ncbi:hypothetical protein Lesp01_68280 [Lentzea sp. NBRC 102530]|nr:hypothetical protein Lesp01_68280 [Lentzea sp. NBRC 102530]
MTRGWIAVLVLGVLIIVAGLVRLFSSLGSERADQISSGVGAGAALVGLILAVMSLVKGRASAAEPNQGTVRQSADNSTVNQPVIQIGGNVTGSVTTTTGHGDSRVHGPVPGTDLEGRTPR